MPSHGAQAAEVDLAERDEEHEEHEHGEQGVEHGGGAGGERVELRHEREYHINGTSRGDGYGQRPVFQ